MEANVFDTGVQISDFFVRNPALMYGPAVKAAPSAVDQPNHAIRPPSAVSDPATVQIVLAFKAVTAYSRITSGQFTFNERRCGFRYPLVSVDDEHPLVSTLIDRELLLVRVPAPLLNQYPGTEGLRDPDRFIHTARIHDHDLVTKGESAQTIRKPFRFVLRNNRHRQQFGCSHPFSLSATRLARRITTPLRACSEATV